MQRLKILFFLPSQADTNDIHHELVTRLASELEPLADIDLYTSTHIPNTEKLTSYSLVHVFGCWSTSSINDEQHIKSLQDTLTQLSPTDWRRIMIYANDEHVTNIIKKGLQRIQFSEPNVVIDNIDRFYIARSYPDGDLPNERLCFRGMITKGRLDDNIKATETNERLLCVQLLNLRHEMENHSAPLLHVANVYTTLRFYDMDEDRLKELVKTLGIEDFAARLMVVLQNVMRLSEGFMPFVTKDDKQRKNMQRKLTKFNTWPSIGNKRS